MSDIASTSLLGKIAGYTEILAKDPHSTIFVPLSEAYRQVGLIDDALEIASNGVRKHPSFGPGYTVLGRIQTQRGAHHEAVSAFEKALEHDKENLAALKGLASLRLQEGDKDKARLLLQRVAAIKPGDAAVLKMLERLGPPSASPPVAGAAPQKKSPPPSNTNLSSPKKTGEPISTSTIAEIYIKQGFPKRALKVYRDLLESDPHNETIRQKLIALKKSLSADDRPALQGGPAADLADSGQDFPAAVAAPVETSAKSGEYAEKLELWLASIQKGRKHVQ